MEREFLMISTLVLTFIPVSLLYLSLQLSLPELDRNWIVFRYRGALGEASTGVSAFADSLEEFGAGHDDPVSVSIGGCWFLFVWLLSLGAMNFDTFSTEEIVGSLVYKN